MLSTSVTPSISPDTFLPSLAYPLTTYLNCWHAPNDTTTNSIHTPARRKWTSQSHAPAYLNSQTATSTNRALPFCCPSFCVPERRAPLEGTKARLRLARCGRSPRVDCDAGFADRALERIGVWSNSLSKPRPTSSIRPFKRLLALALLFFVFWARASCARGAGAVRTIVVVRCVVVEWRVGGRWCVAVSR